MLNNFKDVFDSMLHERTREISGKSFSSSDNYRELEHESVEIANQIRALLPEDSKSLIFELDRINNLMQTYAEDVMYERGLKDGIKLENILKL